MFRELFRLPVEVAFVAEVDQISAALLLERGDVLGLEVVAPVADDAAAEGGALALGEAGDQPGDAVVVDRAADVGAQRFDLAALRLRVAAAAGADQILEPADA